MSREDRRSEEDWRAGAADPNPKAESHLVRYLVGFAILLALAFGGWWFMR